MTFTKILIPAASLLALSSPLLAQDTGAAENPVMAEAASDPISDPARFAAAQSTVDYLFPLGTYERMMKGTMDQMMDAMLGGMSGMSMGDIAAAGGSDAEMTDEEKAQPFGEAMEEMDPHYEERMKISTKVMTDEMVDLMSSMEPEIRTALVAIYARKYTAPQLTEMNAFFASDTGSAFAKDYMMVFVDPEMMQSMMSLAPKMMQAMPDIVKKVEAATAHLPPAPKSDEEIALEAALAGMMSDDDDDFGDDGASDDAEAAWALRENWSAEDLALVNKLDVESDAIYEKYYEAIETAQANAKARLEKK